MLQISNILFARDFSPCSDQAIPYALDLAARTGSTLHTLFADVFRSDPFAPSQEPAAPTEKIRERLRRFGEEDALRTGGFDPGSVRFQHEVVRDVAAATALLRYAEKEDIDVIVMGTHGWRGARRLVLGSIAEEVVRRAKCPVLTVRQLGDAAEERAGAEDGRIKIGSILLPTDFSRHALGALQHAKKLAALYEAQLTLLHVVEKPLRPTFYYESDATWPYEIRPGTQVRAVEQMEALYQKTEGPTGEVRFEARPGRAAHEITTYAQEAGTDLIVMPTHGRTGFEHVLLGSVAEKVVRLAPCPVFTVKSFGKSLLPAPATAASVASPEKA